MRRLITLFAALPVIASLFLSHIFGWKVLNRREKISLTLKQVLEKLKPHGIRYKVVNRVWAAMPLSKDGEALITEKHLDSKEAQIVSAELLRVGMAEINKFHAPMVKWRCKVLKSGYFIPPFVLIGGVLAIAVRRMPAGWFIALFVLVLAGCSVMLWISRGVEKEAAKDITDLITKKRTLPRLSEEEALVDAINAWTWVGILPGILVTLMLKINQEKETKAP